MVVMFTLCLSLVWCAQAHGVHRPREDTQPVIQSADVTTLAPVVVSGIQPGPKMWRIQADGSELWILGTLSPLPTEIDWNAAYVRSVLSEAQEVIWRPRFVLDMDVGFIRKAYLGYRYSRAQRNPGRATLEDVLHPFLYARWESARMLYMPDNRRIERMRPLVAAAELLKAAAEAHGLTERSIVWPKIEPTIKSSGIKLTTPTVRIFIEDPGAALREASNIELNDVHCLETTLEVIEQDLPRMIQNANAWATGAIDRIDTSLSRQRERACTDAFSNSTVSARIGIPDIEEGMNTKTLSTLEGALQRNATTIAILPLSDLLGDDGHIEELRLRGYEVISPTASQLDESTL